MSLIETKIFRKDDVWLVEFARTLRPLTIIEVKGGWIHTKLFWMSAEDFNEKAKVKLGTVRRFLGIPIGMR